MTGFAFVVRTPDGAVAVAFDLQRVDARRDDKPRFMPCPACCNANVEDFAQEDDGIVTCMICKQEFDPEAHR